MHEEVITIQKIWPVFKPGDKRTTIDSVDGRKWRIEVEHLPRLVEAEDYTIGWTAENFNGKSYNLIKNIKPAGIAVPLPKVATANGAARGLFQKLAVEQFDRPIGDLWARFQLAGEVYDRNGAVDLEDSF